MSAQKSSSIVVLSLVALALLPIASAQTSPGQPDPLQVYRAGVVVSGGLCP